MAAQSEGSMHVKTFRTERARAEALASTASVNSSTENRFLRLIYSNLRLLRRRIKPRDVIPPPRTQVFDALSGVE
jgi:hypothetical protein